MPFQVRRVTDDLISYGAAEAVVPTHAVSDVAVMVIADGVGRNQITAIYCRVCIQNDYKGFC